MAKHRKKKSTPINSPTPVATVVVPSCEWPSTQTTMQIWEKIVTGLFFWGLFFLYIFTLAPNISTGDSAELITSAYILGIPHPPGYPLFNLLGKLFSFLPIGNIAYRMNLSSAVFSLGAAFFIYLTVYKLSKYWLAALFAAGFFAVSPIVWEYSLKAEVFALNNLFAALIVYLLMKLRDDHSQAKQSQTFYLTMFVCGLALTNHHTILLLAPAVLLGFYYYCRECLVEMRSILIGLACFIIGLSIYLYAPLRAHAEPYFNWDDARNFAGFFKLVSRGDYGSFTLMGIDGASYSFIEKSSYYLLAIFKQFNPLGVVLAILGLYFLIRQKEKKLISLFLLAYLLTSFFFIFIAKLPTTNLVFLGVFERFYMLSIVILAVLIGLGIYFLKQRKIPSYLFAVIISISLVVSTNINLPEVTQRGNHLFYHYGRDMLSSLEKDAILVVIGDINTFSLNYLQLVQKFRTDVTVITTEKLNFSWYFPQMRKHHPNLILPYDKYASNEQKVIKMIEANINNRPIYFSKYVFSAASHFYENYRLLPMGIVSKLLTKNSLVNNDNYIKENEKLWSQYHLSELKRNYAKTSYEYEVVQQFASFYFALGLEYTQMGLFDLAIREYNKAIATDPALPEAYKNIGIIYANVKHQPKQAIHYWTIYATLNPGDQQNRNLQAYIAQHRH